MDEDDLIEYQLKETFKEKLIRKLKQSIFNTFYYLLPVSMFSRVLYGFLITIEFFQIYTLTIFQISYHDELNTYYNKENKFYHIRYPIKILRLLLVLYKEHNFTFSIILLYLSFIFMISHFIIFIYFYVKEHPKKKHLLNLISVLFFKIMFFFDVCLMTVLHIPLYIIFFSMIQCKNNNLKNYPNESCNNWLYYFNLIISSLNILMLSLLGLLICYFLNENQLIPKVPWNNSFNIIKTIFYFKKIFLVSFYVFEFKHHYKIKVIIISVLSIFGSILRLYNNFFGEIFMGYIIKCYEYSLHLFSIIGLINYCYKSYDYKISTFFINFFCGLGFGIFANFIVEQCNINLFYQNSKLFVDENISFIQILKTFQIAKESKEIDIKNTIFLSILQTHRLKCFDKNCKCHFYFKFIKEHYMQILNENGGKSPIKLAIKKRQSIRRSAIKQKIFDNTRVHSSNPNIIALEDNNDEDLTNLLNLNAPEPLLIRDSLMYEIIRILLENLLKIFPNSQKLKIYFSYLMIFYLGNKYRALYELMKIPLSLQSIEIQYQIFLCRKEIEYNMYQEIYCPNIKMKSINVEKNKLSMEFILYFNKLTNKMFDLINNSSKLLIKFWEGILFFNAELKIKYSITNNSSTESEKNLLDDKKNDLDENNDKKKNKRHVYKLAVLISKNFTYMNNIYYKLRKIESFKSKTVFQLYFEFLDKVIFDEEQLREVRNFLTLNKYFQNNVSNLKEDFLIFHNDKINMDDVGSCVISADLLSLGKILNCNLQFGNIFKYEKDDLKMESINKLIPSYISDFHNDFLLRYLETGKKHIIDKNKLLFGLRSDGLVVPIIFFVKAVPNLDKSIRFIGLVKKLNKNHPFWKPPVNLYETYEENKLNTNIKSSKIVSFILTTHTGKVFGITKNALKLFGIPLNILLPSSKLKSKKIATLEKEKEIENEQKKELDVLKIKKIFPDLKLENYEQKKLLLSELGIEMTIDTNCVKNYFNDFVESLQAGKNQLLRCLKNVDHNLFFIKHQVRISLTEVKFNDGTIGINIFKIILLKNNELFQKIMNQNNENFEEAMSPRIIRKKMKLNANDENENFAKSNYNVIDKKFSSTLRRYSKKIRSQTFKNKFKTISSTKSKNTNEKKNKTEKIKTKNKNILKEIELPKQINYFIFTFVIYLLSQIIFSISEFFLSNEYSQNLEEYNDMYENFNKRNLYLILIIQYFQVLCFYDNKIFDNKTFNRDLIELKLEENINETLRLNNYLHVYLDSVDKEVDEIMNNKIIYSYNLNYNFSINSSQTRLSILIQDIIVKINTLLENYDSLKFEDSNLIFNYYLNETINISDLKFIEYFFIIYNYGKEVRFQLEKIINIMLNKFLNKKHFENKLKNYLLYFSIILIAIAYSIFFYILVKINEYKINILKIFYLVNRKYGEEIIRRCNMFLEYTSNFTHYTKKSIYEVFKKLNKIQINENLKDSKKKLNTYNENQEEEEKNLNSKSHFVDNKGKNEEPVRIMQFWKREEKELQYQREEKYINEKVTKELEDSKKKVKKTLIIINFEIIALLLCGVIYFIIILTLNHNFNKELDYTVEYINIISNRGWMFSNFLFFYREMIVSNSNTLTISDFSDSSLLYNADNLNELDLFYLYLSQSYSIETSIVLLTNQFNNGEKNEILKNFINEENSLNSKSYCDSLMNFDSYYYNLYLSDCQKFYEVNNGLKDNIQIIIGYIQANIPNYSNKTINQLIELIQLNSSFINYNEFYISKAILHEIISLGNGMDDYFDKYQNQLIIRLSIIIFFIFLEFIFFILIWRYLRIMLKKDKEILNIIPNEAISYSQKIKNALRKLNNFK